MARLVEFDLDDGGTMLVEVDDGGGSKLASGTPEKAEKSFEEAVKVIQPVGRSVLAQVRELKPQEVTVEVGIKLSAKAGAILASTAAEGHCKVTLKWMPDAV